MMFFLSLLLLVSCNISGEVPLEPVQEPVPTEPSLPPIISPIIFSALLAPDVVPALSPVTISLCEPFTANTQLLIDGYVVLGTFGENRMSGCMQLTYPGFNSVGIRTLSVGNHTHSIVVIDGREKSYPKVNE